jgi:hypothetical protein
MVLLSCPNDAWDATDRCYLSVWVFPILLMALSMSVDVFPRLGTGVRNLIWADPDDVAVMFMKIGDDFVIGAGE